MNLRRIARGFINGLTGLALLFGAACNRTDDRSSLPGLARHPELPAAFNQELAERYQRAVTGDDNVDAVRNLARLYQANRLYAEAKGCYDLVAGESTGLTAHDHYYVADIARHQDDLGRARDEFRAVLAVEPGYLPARLALAEILLKTGQEDAAREAYSTVLAIEPDQPQAQVGLARIELQAGEEDDAVNRLEAMMAAHPESTEGAALLAQILRRRGETDRAAAFTEISQRRPEGGPADPWMEELRSDLYDPRLLGLEAEYNLRRGQIETAEFYLRRIETMDPSSSVPPLLRGQAEVLVHHDEVAVAHFREALAKGGDWEAICPSITQALLTLDRPAEAVAFIADYYRKMPDSIPIAKAYGDALVANGDDAAARPVLTQVLQAEPYLRRQNMDLARILSDAGDRDAAAECLRRVAAVHADDIPSRALLGEYYLGKLDPVSAIPPLEQALELATPQTPEHEQLSVMLGSAYLKAGSEEAAQGRLTEATDYFEQTTRVVPDDPSAYVALANVFVHLQQYVRAQNVLERLATLQPKNPTILLSLGDILHRQGDLKAAQQHWQKALELVAPEDTRLRQALESRLRGDLPDTTVP